MLKPNPHSHTLPGEASGSWAPWLERQAASVFEIARNTESLPQHLRLHLKERLPLPQQVLKATYASASFLSPQGLPSGVTRI